MNGHKSKHLVLVDLDFVRGSFKFCEARTSSKMEEIVEKMGENLKC